MAVLDRQRTGWLPLLDQFARTPKKLLYGPLSRRLNVSPTKVSLAGFALGMFCVGCAAVGWYGAALGFWVGNRLLDGLDGEIAREHNRQTDLGGYIDIVCDFIVYTAVPIALTVAAPTPTLWLLLALLLGSFFVNAASLMYLAAILEKRGLGASFQGEKTSITMPPGIIEGAETVIFYTLFLVLPQHLTLLFLTMAVLVSLNIVSRLQWAYRHLGETL